jgi:hypothetical protein
VSAGKAHFASVHFVEKKRGCRIGRAKLAEQEPPAGRGVSYMCRVLPALLLATVAGAMPGPAMRASPGHPNLSCRVIRNLHVRTEQIQVSSRTVYEVAGLTGARSSQFQRGTGYIVFRDVIQRREGAGNELLYFRRDGPSPPQLYFTSEAKPYLIVHPAYMLRVISQDEDAPPISTLVSVRGTTLVFGIDLDDSNLGLWFMMATKLPKIVSLIGGVDRILLTSANIYQVRCRPLYFETHFLV